MRPVLRKLRWVGLALAALLVAIQLVPVDRANPPVETDVAAPPDVARILRRSCYDCHSHETRWPWYAYVAPVSFLVAHDVEEARGDLNFSRWPAFDFDEQNHLFEEIREQVGDGTMPLRQYLWAHPGARLAEEDKRILLEWAAPAEPPGEDWD